MNTLSDVRGEVAKDLSGVLEEMREQGAAEEERGWTERWVGCFLRWCAGRGLVAGREAGIEWLRGARRAEGAGSAWWEYKQKRAALTTYFHLTGQARGSSAEGGGVWRVDGSGEGAGGGGRAGNPAGGKAARAGTWGEAGARLKGYLACKGYAQLTCECYVGWARRFWRWCAGERKRVEAVDAAALREFLEFLAGTQVGAKTQNQALNALVCFFRHGIGEEPGEIGEYLRAKAGKRLPVVLNRREASALMEDLKSRGRAMWLMAAMMLGAGLRQREMLELRVQDIDLERGVITVRRGKGNKDRVTMLPERVKDGLREHLEWRRAEYEADLTAGAGYVPLPEALDRKKPEAARSWGWQYVFGGQHVIEERATGRRIRWHVHENTVGRLLRDAARRCGIPRAVTCHALRHTFATLALENGTDIRTLQELLGHNDVATTMIYTHVLNKPGVVARSPLDGLAA